VVLRQEGNDRKIIATYKLETIAAITDARPIRPFDSGLHNHETPKSTEEGTKAYGDSINPIVGRFSKCALYHFATKVPRFP
jgi:hypothetical protein